ncbi:MAG: Gfo/Idh/MocA family protein [Planctomycetota bacterium]
MHPSAPSQVKTNTSRVFSRRRFLAGAGAATVGMSLVGPETIRAASANEKVDIGLIGCGGRGSWIADLFQKHGGYNIVAAADYFEDRVTAFGDRFDVKTAARFTGLDGYKRLLEQPVDAVVIESPPYFHPEQAAAGVEAGKHVYVAKPIAVDVPGCKTIEKSGQKATERSLCFLIDFQTRADSFYIEAIKRVHAGAIGQYAFGESSYHAGIPWMGQIKHAKQAATNPEARLRAWGLDQILSGDIITEQNIHTLDVASWIMDRPPVCAFGTGGRKVRDFGNCWDTFSITFVYPNNVGIAFSSRQFDGCGTKPDGIRNRMFGDKGVLETKYGGRVMVRTVKGNEDDFYPGGSSPGIFREGAVANIATFHANILAEKHDNPTVAPSVRSNLVTILGRTAAYAGEVVQWDKLLATSEKLEADLGGLKR